MSALRPADTARAWSPDAPYDCVKLTPLPAPVFWNEVINLPSASRGVEYATRLSFVSDGRAEAVVATARADTATSVSTAARARLMRNLLFSIIPTRVIEISGTYTCDKRSTSN